jgi:outer membrane protein assembly complex protein YaeT
MVATAGLPDVPRPRGWRIARILAVVGVALAILATAALLFLHTSPARRFVVSQVTRLLQQQNIEFNTDELSYNLLSLRLALRNVRIRSHEAPDLPPFAEIDRISADLSLRALLRRRYVVEGEAEGVTLRYVVDATGRDNVPRPPRDPEAPSKPLDYLIDELRIRNANVQYENQQQGIELAVPVSSIEVDGNALTDRHTVRLDAAAGRFVLQQRKGTIDSLKGELDLGDDDVRFESVDLNAEGAQINLTGTIAQFADPQADLRVRGSIDAARAAAMAALDERLTGAVTLDARVQGRVTQPAIEGTVNASNLSVRNLSELNLSATAAYDLTARRATVSELHVRAPFGDISGQGVVTLNEAETSRLTATVSRLDAAAIMRAFETPYTISSRVDAQVQAEWPALDYLRATGDATLALTPAMVRPTRSAIPVGGRIEITGRTDAIDAVLRRVSTAGAEVTGRVRLANRRDLAGTAQLRVADVARAVAAAESVMGRRAGTLLPMPVSGAMQADARISGTLSSPVVAAQIAAPALAVGNASDLALTGNVTYTPALVSVRAFDVQWQQARAHAEGTVGLTGAQRLDLNVNADALQLGELLRAMQQSGVPASGTVALQARVGGTLTAPAVNATIAARDLVAYDERWGTLTAEATLLKRQLAISNLLLDKPQSDGNGRITGAATYQLDRRTYTADLRSQDIRLESFTLPDGRPLRGTLQLSANGAGSIDNPAGSINLVADALQLDRYALGRIAADATLANQQARITVTAPTYGVNGSGVVATRAPYPANATIRIEDLQLGALPIELQTPLEGTLRGTVDAAAVLGGEGEIMDTLQATARIDAFSGAWNAQPFRIDPPAVVRYARRRLGIEALRLVAQDSTLAVSGDLPLDEGDAPGAITIDARANLATLARYAPVGTDLTASGDLSLTGVIRGTLKTIDPDVTLVVSNAAVSTPAIAPGLTNLNVRSRVASGEAAIEQLTGNFGPATITAAGRIPLEAAPALPVDIPRRGGPATFTASVRGLDLSQVPGTPQGLGGRVSLDARMSAARADLLALEGEITFPELELAFQGLTLAQQQTSRIVLANGQAQVQQFALAGSVGTLAASGTVALTGERPIDVDAKGNLNVAVISVFTDAVRAEGATTLDVAARGTMSAPELNGFVTLEDANFLVDEPTIAAEGVNARVDLSGRRISIARLTGTLNGGSLNGSGFVELGGTGVADAALEVTTQDVAFDAPLDLRSLSDAKVRLVKRGDEFVVEGQVTLDEAGLTGDINFDEGLLAAMQARRRLDLTEERNPFLDRVRFNLDIDTATPILIDNNLARAEVTADLRLLGSPYEPGLSGRLSMSDESEITLNERRYQVEHGDITFLGERSIQPSFDLLLNTTARNYDITIAVTGTPGDTETTLTSDPTLPEPDIMALLATGRTLEEMRGEEFEVAQEQVLSYLAGRVGSQLGRGLERATGLSTVRIEPNLIANETEPSARLTVGQDLTDDLELVYSTNLTDSSDQVWVVDYDVTRRFQTSAVRQSDNSFRFDVRHDVRLGGRPAPRRMERQRPTISAVTITGDGRIADTQLRNWLSIEPDDRYDFFAARDAVEEVEEHLEELGRLQSRVRLQRENKADSVVVTLRVVAGPRVDLVFQGAAPSGKVLDEVRTKWRRGVFDTQRIDDSIDVLRAWLMRDNYLQPKVDGTVEEIDQDHRSVHFRIDRGTRFAKVILSFAGAKGIDASELDKIIKEQHLEQPLFTDPTQVTELLEHYYREQGFLVADVAAPKYEFEGTVARIVVNVTEGPRFVVRDVTATGTSVIPGATLAAELPVQPGDPFLPFAAENALDHIRDVYWRRGYNDVHSDYDLVLDRNSGRVDVRFSVSEGAQSVIAGITVQGNDKTSERLVREQLELQDAQPLDLGALARSRRNLYDTGAFSVVDIVREEKPAATGQQPVQLNVSVREVQPIQFQYGLSYDSERGAGGIVDLSNHNSIGKARVLGVRARYDGEIRELRGSMSQPSLRYWPIVTTASIYYRDERNRAIETTTGRFDVERRGVSVQQERELGSAYVWSWGYRFERAHTIDVLGGTFDETVKVSPLTTTITRETRDEVLDATRGSFFSHAFSYSPTWLGADDAFIKYFGQYFHYFPLQRERRERFTNEILRPRLVYAVGVRIGLANGIGTVLLPRSERFFAGGGTSIRGFEHNAAGPIDPTGLPLGGDAMLVINNELRVPLVSIFDGVVFTDIGNVFPRVSDFSFTDLRETAGVGLRARTRWFLVRGDYGFLLDPRAGERRSRFYISIGQAF